MYIIDSGRPEKVVFYVHGDGYKKKSGLESRCHSLDPGHELNAALVCVWRPDNNNRQRRHQPPEIDAFAKAVRAVSGSYPNLPMHCLGRSAGGIICIGATQRHVDLDFGCLVAGSSSLDPIARARAGGWTISRLKPWYLRRWNAAKHVAKTRVGRLIVVGDPKDPVVKKAGWESLISAAEKVGFRVEYKLSNRGHRTERDGRQAMEHCLKNPPSTIKEVEMKKPNDLKPQRRPKKEDRG